MGSKQANNQIFKFECTKKGSPNAGLGIQTWSITQFAQIKQTSFLIFFFSQDSAFYTKSDFSAKLSP